MCVFFDAGKNQCCRQAALQKIVRRSYGSVISTKVSQFRQWNEWRMAWDLTFLECFQYSRSQWAEQNLRPPIRRFSDSYQTSALQAAEGTQSFFFPRTNDRGC